MEGKKTKGKERQRNVKTGKNEKLTKKEKENTSLIAKLRECKESQKFDTVVKQEIALCKH